MISETPTLPPAHLLDQEPSRARDALGQWLDQHGQPRFRREQILSHIFERRVIDPARMGGVPGVLRTELETAWLPRLIDSEAVHVSTDGTRKYRFRMARGHDIEAVWIPSGTRGTLCISSQAGCPARCSFCATGHGGFRRNLSAAEIIAQWIRVGENLSQEQAGSITQIVFMGMGEPLLNYERVAIALRALTSSDGFRFSPRRITVSTVGIPDAMRRLCTDFPQVRLALSLHSAVDATRATIVPMNRKHSLADLRRTLEQIGCDHRRVSLEYVLLKGVNDSLAEARALASFAAATAGHVNLIPFHPFPGAPHAPVPRVHMHRFARAVASEFSGPVTIRRSRGLDIAGACGQLALLEAQSANASPPPAAGS